GGARGSLHRPRPPRPRAATRAPAPRARGGAWGARQCRPRAPRRGAPPCPRRARRDHRRVHVRGSARRHLRALLHRQVTPRPGGRSDERGAQCDKWTVARRTPSPAATAQSIIAAERAASPDRSRGGQRSRDMDIDELVKAVQTLNADDAFRARLTLDNWRTIAPYLARYEIRAGDLLIKQGDADRSMYFLAQGSMQIFMTGGPPGANKVAILRAGAVVGEPGLFGDTPRTANVEAMTPCVVWALRGPRMEELAQRSPALALELLRAAGAVMATRFRATLNKQAPVT